MSIKIIAGYQFIKLFYLDQMRGQLFDLCKMLDLQGTILLSEEGLNVNLAGIENRIDQFIMRLKNEFSFLAIPFNESLDEKKPFKKLKVKIKKEIIALRQSHIQPEKIRAPLMAPTHLKRWLDEGKPCTLLDMRNRYEVEFGTFKDAIHLDLKHFNELPKRIHILPKNQPIITFCTSGIRCEKGALYLLEHGFKNVFQLQGGILNYFTEVGSDFYQNTCFVFDDRIAIDSQLKPLSKND